MKITKAVGPPRPRAGFLISADHVERFRLPSFVVDRTFERGIWKQMNKEFGTEIDEYEGVSLDPGDLKKASEIIRQDLNQDLDAPNDYAEFLRRAADMLQRSADRHVAVMFSL